MEMAPPRWRGVLSGVLQSGYPIGYLLAALAARFVLPHANWRVMFWLGGVPALLALYIRTKVPESEAWRQHREQSMSGILRTLRNFANQLLFLVLMMTLFMFLSHGTQDPILPIDRASRQIARDLRSAGFSVNLREFNGEHTVPPDVAREAFEWLTR